MTESNTLLVEPFGGMAGDMFLAALLDLDDPRFRIDDLQRFADALVPGEARLGAERVWRRSLSGLYLEVRTPETSSPPTRRFCCTRKGIAYMQPCRSMPGMPGSRGRSAPQVRSSAS